ncbi:hypothetical protein KY290_035793 [Solanum tuberosum]|uniref:Uncharacterized protein n=1 Tax=Solanum tuberosum TaxID=4113 RepID=A0ABQ7TST7_SOLTU|nr:hypothetical protein KY284_035159 [Solanum tuberosum]KAH0737088.1 hypothetical protein KY290_035793 [Solanum tuberosum]
MPQVDLETLVSACAGGGSDRKVACETLADRDDGEKRVKDDEKQSEHPPDFPPESFWLSKDAEFDWFDRNAFLDRKQSTKGIGPGSNSSSQRFSSTLKSKASIIGFPKTNYVDSKRRTCKPANFRLFPAKRSESTLKSASVTEPSSPKVSCMGRVRSKRRSRSRRSSEKSKKCEKNSLERSRSNNGEKRKSGFCSRLLSIFRSNRSNKKPASSSTDKTLGSKSTTEPIKPLRKSKSVSVGKTRGGAPVSVEPVFSEPAGLGGMKRFSSGRRSESWGGDEINAVV